MPKTNSLRESINSVNESTFDALALEVFHHQYQENEVYRDYVKALNREPKTVKEISQIPFLPISFFKQFQVKSGNWEEQKVFESSGTTGSTSSKHYVKEESYYLKGCKTTFEAFYGPIEQYQIFALLPSYLERGNSGLISMVNEFLKYAQSGSGFYLNEFDDLAKNLRKAKQENRPTILWGVTFALLDFAEAYQIDFSDLIVMETGGMKGRREEMIRKDVHAILESAFGVSSIHSEYGMTELFSQAYSKEGGGFMPSRIMKVIARDLNDPFNLNYAGRTAGLNVIDLANYETCSFIETQDLGKVYEDGSFEVLGRIDNSEIRGCNLMIS